MSILTTVEAVPSRLFAIYGSLFDSENGETEERLEAWATPPSLKNSGGEEGSGSITRLFTNSLQEARRLGLVEQLEDRLRLTADARGGGKKGRDSAKFFLNYLRRTLFDVDRAAETQQRGFMLGLTWFLNTNPLKPLNFSEDQSFIIKKEIGDNAAKTECTAILNYQNMLYWARFLGFATIVGDGNSRRAIADPVKAIDFALPTIFSDSAALPIETFLNRLAAIFPVFERGTVRQEYDDMRLDVLVDAAHRLSVSTSIALQRLNDRQTIAMTSVADAPARVLDFGSREGRVSHVALKRAT